MKQVTAVGLDIAKHVFQAHGVDKAGRVAFKPKLRRHEVEKFFGNLEPCVVGIEASGSAHHGARVLRAFGHTRCV